MCKSPSMPCLSLAFGATVRCTPGKPWFHDDMPRYAAHFPFHVYGKPEKFPTRPNAALGDLAECRLTKAVANNLNEGNSEHPTRRSQVSSCIGLVNQFGLTKELHCEPFTLTCWYMSCGFPWGLPRMFAPLPAPGAETGKALDAPQGAAIPCNLARLTV